MEYLERLLEINLEYIAIGLLTVFFLLEQLLNTQFNFDRRPQHLIHNLMFLMTQFVINLFWAGLIVNGIIWLNGHQIGLFFLFEDIPTWIKLICGVVMADFMTYWFHRMAHIFPLVWRLHRVHHSDTTMDSSTFYRGHPLENLLWWSLADLVTVAIFGFDLTVIGFYYLVLTPFVMIEHTNLKYPVWLDKTIGWVITTPNFHKIHHEQDQKHTDSNFADIFICFK